MRESQMELECIDCSSRKIVYSCQVKEGPSQRYKIVDGVYRCKKCWDKKRKGIGWNPKKAESVVKICLCCGVEKTYPALAASKLNSEYHCRSCYIKKRINGELPQRVKPTSAPSGERLIKVTCPDCGKERINRWDETKSKW